MRFNFPIFGELSVRTLWLMYHPLALFNVNSRFQWNRRHLDHEHIWQRHFGLLREAETGIEWVEPMREETK